MVLHSAHRCLSICALLCKRARVFTNKVMRFWATKSRAFYNIPINTLAINRSIWNFFVYFIRPAPWATYVTFLIWASGHFMYFFNDEVLYILNYDILYFPESMIFSSFPKQDYMSREESHVCTLKYQEGLNIFRYNLLDFEMFWNVSAFQFLSIEQDKVNWKHRMANSLKWLPFGKMKNKFRKFTKLSQMYSYL